MSNPSAPAPTAAIVGYARVSTADQSLDQQTAALEAAGCTRVFTDTASGRKRREGLAEAVDYLRPGDTLVAVALDRIGRSAADTCALIRDLTERGVTVRLLREGLDTSSAPGRAVAAIMAAVAELEVDLNRERTSARLSVMRDQGQRIGRPPKLTAEQVRQARALIDGGESVAATARALGVARPTLYRALEATDTKAGAA